MGWLTKGWTWGAATALQMERKKPRTTSRRRHKRRFAVMGAPSQHSARRTDVRYGAHYVTQCANSRRYFFNSRETVVTARLLEGRTELLRPMKPRNSGLAGGQRPPFAYIPFSMAQSPSSS